MVKEKMEYGKLFIKLASPDSEGKSRWVNKNEFVGEYSVLITRNGGSWSRENIVKCGKIKYLVEKDKTKTSGNSIDAISMVHF